MQQLTRHNSCVEFSFLANGASSNTSKLYSNSMEKKLYGLTHLLFFKIERKRMSVSSSHHQKFVFCFD